MKGKDNMKKYIISILFLFVFVFNGFCANIGDVKDNNNGEEGYLLIHSGEINGKNNDIGIWTAPKEWIEQYKDVLKGDTGATGADGKNGIDGIDGSNGLNGKDGKDFDPIEVNRLDDRIDATSVDISSNKTQLSKHETRIKNNENKINELDNRVEDLEKTQTIIEGEVRVIDTKKWTVKPFIRYNETRSKFDIVGVRFTYKIGKSYEEKRIEELEARLKKAGL